jgi:hypothetical protein
MSNYEVGFGRPPRATQFKPGQSGNIRGRPKKTPAQLENLARQVLDAPMQYRENGRIKTGPMREVAIKLVVDKAVKGSIEAAELLLAMRTHAMQHGERGVERLIVTDWLPDHPGQTGDQKTQALQAAAPIPGEQSYMSGAGQSPVSDNQPPQNEQS